MGFNDWPERFQIDDGPEDPPFPFRIVLIASAATIGVAIAIVAFIIN